MHFARANGFADVPQIPQQITEDSGRFSCKFAPCSLKKKILKVSRRITTDKS